MSKSVEDILRNVRNGDFNNGVLIVEALQDLDDFYYERIKRVMPEGDYQCLYDWDEAIKKELLGDK
jgi:hypothetical protein